jgi:predicted ribosomally synthesized peptide with nif11-like leader
LLAKLKEDEGLLEKFNGEVNFDSAMAIAKAAGFVISAEDLQSQGELSDEELESVAVGTLDPYYFRNEVS